MDAGTHSENNSLALDFRGFPLILDAVLGLYTRNGLVLGV